MAKKAKPSRQDEQKSVGICRTTSQPMTSLTEELLALKLSDGQCRTILKYVELPAHLSERFAATHNVEQRTQFTLDELDELLDDLEASVYRAKGSKSRRSYGSLRRCPNSSQHYDPDEMSEEQLPRNTDTVFQIKVTLMGIVPSIWRRIQTQDCTLVELHDLLQVTMGWEFEHLYRFIIGDVKYADLTWQARRTLRMPARPI